jgi:hypothetical protein
MSLEITDKHKARHNKEKQNEETETRQSPGVHAFYTAESNADVHWHTAVAIGIRFRADAADFPGIHSVIIQGAYFD